MQHCVTYQWSIYWRFWSCWSESQMSCSCELMSAVSRDSFKVARKRQRHGGRIVHYARTHYIGSLQAFNYFNGNICKCIYKAFLSGINSATRKLQWFVDERILLAWNREEPIIMHLHWVILEIKCKQAGRLSKHILITLFCRRLNYNYFIKSFIKQLSSESWSLLTDPRSLCFRRLCDSIWSSLGS